MAFSLFTNSLFTHSGGNHLWHPEDTPAALWTGPGGKNCCSGHSERRTEDPANNHTCELRNGSSSSNKPLAACSPCHHRVCNFIGDPESDHPAKALLNSDPQNGGNTYHCLKPLSLGIICYAATDSYNREKSGTQKCFIKLLAGKQLKKNCMDEDAHI